MYVGIVNRNFVKNSCISPREFFCLVGFYLVGSLGYATKIIISSTNENNFISSFLMCMFEISISCHIALVNTSRTMLHSSSERGHSCLVPDLREKTMSFSSKNNVYFWFWYQCRTNFIK